MISESITKPLLVVLDYDMGNVCSIQNMIKKIGAKAIISRDPEDILKADKLILPGVGSYDTGMEKLSKYDLIDQIRAHALEKKKPILGICLGMQLLGRRSEEGMKSGLGLISFDVVRFNFDKIEKDNDKLKIPHMGWDIVQNNAFDPVTEDLTGEQRYYFVHSYHAICDSQDNELMTCDYGYTFAAAVRKDKIYGVQFHPEKSHLFGMKFLENFIVRV